MADTVEKAFEQELTRRGVGFRVDDASRRYAVNVAGQELLVSLDNLARSYEQDRDISEVARFVDAVLATEPESRDWASMRAGVFFCLEPSDYAEQPEFRSPVSDHVDRVPVHWDAAAGHITWVSQWMLDGWQVALADVAAEASNNLAGVLARAKVEHWDIDGARLGSLGSDEIPFKTALLLAPNLKAVVAPILGWPLLAVIPDRDFLYLWDAAHHDLANRVGGVVVREFNAAPYPLTTEVFRIGDDGISAIGAFSKSSTPD